MKSEEDSSLLRYLADSPRPSTITFNYPTSCNKQAVSSALDSFTSTCLLQTDRTYDAQLQESSLFSAA